MKTTKTLLLFLLSSFCLLQLSAAPPTTPASNMLFSGVDGGQMYAQWTSGDGARRILVVSASGPITGLPVDGVDYNASSTFGNGDQLNPGEYVMYDATAGATWIYGLSVATTYYFAVFEYNGTGFSTEYLTSSFATGSQATVSAPTTSASGIVISNVTGNSMTISWSNGDGSGRMLLMKEGAAVDATPANQGTYSANSNFGLGTQVGTGNYVVYESSGSSVTVTNLQPGTTYYLEIFEYNGFSSQAFLAPGTTASQTTGTTPTVATTNLQTQFAQGNYFRLSWTNGNGARRIVVVSASGPVTGLPVNGVDYNPSSTFGAGDQLNPGEYIVYDNISSFVDVYGLSPATTYFIAVFEYNGSGTATYYQTLGALTGSGATLGAPTVQTSGITVGTVTGNSIQLSWTNGDGSGRMILMRQGSPVNANPVDLGSYSANAAYGLGSQVGTGNYVVYESTGSTVTITNLNPGQTYHFAIFEYNGSSGQVFLVPGATGSQATGGAPTLSASAPNFTIIQGNFIRFQWTVGNGSRRIVIARAGAPVTAVPVDGTTYSASGTFGNGDELAPGEFVVYDNTSTLADVYGLSPATTYHFAVYEYNGTGAFTLYQTIPPLVANQSTLFPPTTSSTNLVFSNVTGNSMQLTWTPGNGSGRMVLMRPATPVNAAPVSLTNYSPSTAFGFGSQIGTGNYVVYQSSGSTVTVTNLSPGTTYHVEIFEYNGTSGRVYESAGLTGSQTTGGAPTLAASNLTFSLINAASIRLNWTSGGGTRRMIVARAGSPVTGTPVDGTTYAANSTFANGDQLAPGEYVIYDGTSTFLDLNGLSAATTYHFAIFEYNGSGATSLYQQTGFLTGSQSTVSAPTVQASNLTAVNVTGTTVQLSWTVGNGFARILLAKEGSAVDSDPVDGNSYSPSVSFGSGSQIGTGNYVVYRSTGTSVTVTNLIPNQTYHFALYEYNGSSTSAYTTPATILTVTTVATPTVQASNLTFSQIGFDQMQVNWTNGNGSRRIVLAKAGTPVDANPADGTGYSASATWQAGDQIGTGNYVVYGGTATSVLVDALPGATTMHFAVFEYGGLNATAAYLTPGLTGSQATASVPVTAPSALTFPSRTNTSITLGWTNGSGTGRLVVATQAGAVLNAIPTSGTAYNSGNFGNGSAIGNGFVVYNGNGTGTTVGGLLTGTTYTFYLFEYAGVSSSPALNPTPLSGSEFTLGPPAIQASLPVFSAVTATSATISWTNGGGQNRLVAIRLGAAVAGVPTDGVTYVANSFYGAGDLLNAGEFVVYAGNGSSVTVTNLQPSTSYEIAIFEYNGTGATSQFNIVSPASGSFTTDATPFPVEWAYLRAEWLDDGQALISWGTASEHNSDFFEIEKLQQESNIWEAVGQAKASGFSQEVLQYDWIDQPGPAGALYRIRQVDLDGQESYSSTVELAGRESRLLLYPNPASDIIHGTLSESGAFRVTLTDLQGRLIRTVESMGGQFIMSLQDLPEGIYHLTVQGQSFQTRTIQIAR